MKRVKSFAKRAIAIATATAVIVGCANTGGGGASSASTGTEDPCNVANSAITGALAGAFLGALMGGKKGAATGAAAGSLVGALACVAINSESKQVKTAQQVDKEYVKVNKKLPNAPELLTYDVKTSANSIQRGTPVTITSTVEVVNGAKEPVREIREELQVFNPDGTAILADPKSKPLAKSVSGGRYENSFVVNMPAQARQGNYTFKTNLYVNNKLTSSRQMQTQVAFNYQEKVMLLASK